MLQSLVARFVACIKAFSQSFLLPRDSPVWATLWLQIFSCLYAFPHVLPSAWSYLFLHVKKKLVSRYIPISFNSLGFLNFTFLFLFYPSSFLSLSRTRSFGQHLICWVLSGSCGPPLPDSFECGCPCLLLCFRYILWALLYVTKTYVGKGQ